MICIPILASVKGRRRVAPMFHRSRAATTLQGQAEHYRQGSFERKFVAFLREHAITHDPNCLRSRLTFSEGAHSARAGYGSRPSEAARPEKCRAALKSLRPTKLPCELLLQFVVRFLRAFLYVVANVLHAGLDAMSRFLRDVARVFRHVFGRVGGLICGFFSAVGCILGGILGYVGGFVGCLVSRMRGFLG